VRSDHDTIIKRVDYCGFVACLVLLLYEFILILLWFELTKVEKETKSPWYDVLILQTMHMDTY